LEKLLEEDNVYSIHLQFYEFEGVTIKYKVFLQEQNKSTGSLNVLYKKYSFLKLKIVSTN
jgi:hypothetical protein